jgi:hypothetical protein
MEQDIQEHVNQLAKRLTREIKAQDCQIVMSYTVDLMLAIANELDKKYKNDPSLNAMRERNDMLRKQSKLEIVKPFYISPSTDGY